ncbi:hypothetical protein KCP74_06125 [Salmonella enterica subsp. enterica]|nr:hypothetical protein KCP74_06125 [Salmonella enterica subsp. enterica]
MRAVLNALIQPSTLSPPRWCCYQSQVNQSVPTKKYTIRVRAVTGRVTSQKRLLEVNFMRTAIRRARFQRRFALTLTFASPRIVGRPVTVASTAADAKYPVRAMVSAQSTATVN